MFPFARVPFGGRKGHGQPFQRAIKFFESAVAPHVDTSRFRVYGGDANPAVASQLIQPPVGLDHGLQPSGGGLDDEQDANGFMDRDHLPWQSGAQVADVEVWAYDLD